MCDVVVVVALMMTLMFVMMTVMVSKLMQEDLPVGFLRELRREERLPGWHVLSVRPQGRVTVSGKALRSLLGKREKKK